MEPEGAVPAQEAQEALETARAERDLLRETVARQRAELDGLRTALESRAGIEQAKGAIRATTGLTEDEAFAVLRDLSQRRNRRLRGVAADVLASLLERGDGQVAAPVPSARLLGCARPSAGSPSPEDTADGEPWRVRASLGTDVSRVREPMKLRAVVELALLLVSLDGPDDVGEAVVRRGLALLGAYAGTIAVLEADGRVRTRTAGYSEAFLRSWHGIGLAARTPITDAMRSGTARYFETRPSMADAYPEVGFAPKTCSLCAVPLLSDDVVVGALGLSYESEHVFTPEVRTMLELAGHLVAATLVRSRRTDIPD